MTDYRRWMRICTDLGCIGTAVLAAWAIPLLHEKGLVALLPQALTIALGWLAITAGGALFLWLRVAWHSTKGAEWLPPIDPFLATNREI